MQKSTSPRFVFLSSSKYPSLLNGCKTTNDVLDLSSTTSQRWNLAEDDVLRIDLGDLHVEGLETSGQFVHDLNANSLDLRVLSTPLVCVREIRRSSYLEVDHGENGLQPVKAFGSISLEVLRDDHPDGESNEWVQVGEECR